MASRSGITWIECAVAGGILGLALAVLLPGLLYLRAAARREQCLQNLQALGRAAAIYTEQQGALPAGSPARGPNWLAALLPQLGEQQLAQQALVPDAAGLPIPAGLRCPVAPHACESWQLAYGPQQRIAKGSYAANFGADVFLPAQQAFRGVFEVEATVRPADWQAAGGAKTLLASELLAVPSERDGRGAWLHKGMGGAAFTARLLPNARGMGRGEANRDRIVHCDPDLAEDNPLRCLAHDPHEESGTFSAARSAHGGGVHAVFLDGHTAFLPDGMDLAVWRTLATRQAD